MEFFVNKAFYVLFYSLVIGFSITGHTLVPLEGLIYGDVKDIKQYDPLSNIHSKNSVVDRSKLSEFELDRFKKYIGLYRQGANLKFSCDFSSEYSYSTKWQERQAKRTIVSTLQYLGLDISIKAIVKYMKMLEFSEEQFNNLTTNLVNNTCSKNISTYSIKLIKANFKHLYHSDSANTFELPSLVDSPFFSDRIKERTNSHQAKKNELKMSVLNFRSFCSWGGDTDNYRMLAPYLNNPYVMSFVFNQLLSREISWNNKNKTIEYSKVDDSVKMSCEDLICRRSENVEFLQTFPRMIGSTNLEVDFKNLYCEHFEKSTYQVKDQNEKVKKWINQSSDEESLMEAMNFTALISGFPDLLLSSTNFSDLKMALKENIQGRWNKWAKEKSNQFVTDLMYEESLNIDLYTMVNSVEVLKGNFQVIFDFSLGEMDKELSIVDKISSNFNLSFPKSYLRWIRNEYIKRSNKSDYAGIERLKGKLVANINLQLEAKEKLFLIPLWNKKMGGIITNELVDQLVNYKGSYFTDFSHKSIKVPVKFRFGLFALKYLNEKFKANYRNSNTLSLTLKK